MISVPFGNGAFELDHRYEDEIKSCIENPAIKFVAKIIDEQREAIMIELRDAVRVGSLVRAAQLEGQITALESVVELLERGLKEAVQK